MTYVRKDCSVIIILPTLVHLYVSGNPLSLYHRLVKLIFLYNIDVTVISSEHLHFYLIQYVNINISYFIPLYTILKCNTKRFN